MQKTPDFQLEAMTMMYHFCLIEDSGAAKVSTLPASSGSSIGSAVNSSNQNQSEILNNLLHVFLSSSDAKVLKGQLFQNVLMKNQFYPKYQRKIFRDFCPSL